MAGILNFAHLKRQAKDTPKMSGGDAKKQRQEDGEFYRLQDGSILPAADIKKTVEEGREVFESPANSAPGDFNFTAPVERIAVDGQQRTTYRIPSIAETALLIKVNFCVGCPRFCRAGDEQRYDLPASKNGYGWCWRIGKDGRAMWMDIPGNATVARCYFLITWGK